MNKSLFILLLLLNIAALAISLVWLANERKYDACLAVVLALAGLAGLYYNRPQRSSKDHQRIENTRNSGIINQAGRDIVN